VAQPGHYLPPQRLRRLAGVRGGCGRAALSALPHPPLADKPLEAAKRPERLRSNSGLKIPLPPGGRFRIAIISQLIAAFIRII